MRRHHRSHKTGLLNRAGVQVGQAAGAPSQFGCVDGTTLTPTRSCAPGTVLGNAGLPGCGTGTLPGTECNYKLIWKKTDVIAAGGTFQLEMLAARAAAFKPRYVYMFGIDPTAPSTNLRFEITNVTVMDAPELVTIGTAALSTDRGLSDFFNRQDYPMAVDWSTFGANPGQGIKFDFVNLSAVATLVIYVCLWGDGASQEHIGAY